MRCQNIIKNLSYIMEEFSKNKGDLFQRLADRMCESLKAGRKILVFGNGGSAAQAQHFCAELVNKFLIDRPAICAISLTTDTSALTSIANDSSFDYVFSRQIEALGTKGDIAIGLSTSGNSPNIIEAIKTAKKRGLLTAAFTGKGGGNLASLPDFLIDVPSEETPRIQEIHLILFHLLAQKIEEDLS